LEEKKRENKWDKRGRTRKKRCIKKKLRIDEKQKNEKKKEKRGEE
jgi:hypothetical protein